MYLSYWKSQDFEWSICSATFVFCCIWRWLNFLYAQRWYVNICSDIVICRLKTYVDLPWGCSHLILGISPGSKMVDSYIIITLHKFQEKNLNLNRNSNFDLQISSLALCHWAILVLIAIHLQTLLLKCLPLSYKAVWPMTLPAIYWLLSELTSLLNKYNALNQIIKCLIKLLVKINIIICAFVHFHFINFKRKTWTWTRIRTQTSTSLVWRSTIELSWFNCQFVLKPSSWNNKPLLQGGL